MPAGELSTRNIVQDALQNGKKVYIPYIHKVDQLSIMDMLALNSMAEFESLQPDKWGIPSLQATQIPGRRNCFDATGLDLIVMPGMAFDQGFRRLGHGKGYYDHFLTRYSKWSNKMPFLGKRSSTTQDLEKKKVPKKIFPDFDAGLSRKKDKKLK